MSQIALVFFRNISFLLVVSFSLLVTIVACDNGFNDKRNDPQGSQKFFHEVASEYGIDFVHRSDVNGDYRFPEVMGSGAAVFDYDQDGLLDLYLINSGKLGSESDQGKNRLYRQLADGTYIDVTVASKLGDTGYGMGVAIGDIDNDSYTDVFVTNLGRDRIYRNLGNGTFEDLTLHSGIDVQDWSTSATFCDVNMDDLLDLYVGTYVVEDPSRICQTTTGDRDYCAPNIHRAVPDRLFLNRGNFSFEERPIDSLGNSKPNRALGVICADFNDDSHLDFYVANDGERNFLWVNNGNGTFAEKAISMGSAVNLFGETEASMGIDIADLNFDDRLDIFVTHLDTETDTMYMSDGALYTDATTLVGLAQETMRDSGFGVAFADFDHDGDEDLFIVNGNVRKRSIGPSTVAADAKTPIENYLLSYRARNRLFLNGGNASFESIDNEVFGIEDASGVSRGLVTADIDRDGDVDALVTDSNGPVKLYLNNVPKQGNWIQIRPVDLRSKRVAIGSVVRVFVNDRWLLRPVLHTRGYLTSQDAAVHFGLGNKVLVEKIEIDWLDGVTEEFGPLKINQQHTLVRGSGTSFN